MLGVLAACVVVSTVPRLWCGRDAGAFLRGDVGVQRALAEELVAFEARDDRARTPGGAPGDRFAGEWALVTHQMTALGLAEVCLAHPELLPRYGPVTARAAEKSFLPEMREFGTRAWGGEDAVAGVAGGHGHAYLAYAALAVGMARSLGVRLSPAVTAQHDALIAAYERRLLASATGLIETYPGEAYPTDVAAVAAAIAVHGRARVTGVDHRRVLAHWAERVAAVQIDAASGLVIQRMGARDGKAHDAPRGSGTALAAYFAGFADRAVADRLAAGVLRHESTWLGFGAIREYAEGHSGSGDIDSGPVLLGVSVSATGFALAPARATGDEVAFTRLFRTTELFGMRAGGEERARFTTGGPIGNALLLAVLASGPERAP
ncbi:MAG: hypothetical protein WKG00_10365 [Polyangiaceae bacterium]